jgi:SAM-dependent methyltransferase
MTAYAMDKSLSSEQKTKSDSFSQQRIEHWDKIAIKTDAWRGLGGAYARQLSRIYAFLIPPGHKVLEIGSGLGQLLAAVQPSYGLGVDFSQEMVRRAQAKFPHLEFVVSDGHSFDAGKAVFDYIILSDLVNDIWDVQLLFEHIAQYTHLKTRVIINYYNRLWQWPLWLAQNLNLAKSTLPQNWLTKEDVNNLLYLTGYQPIRSWEEVLLPLPIPFLASISNKYLVKLPLFRHFALTNFTIARPLQREHKKQKDVKISVIIPARNEAGNISSLMKRVPEIGKGSELIFVEGHSTDDTYAVIEQEIAKNPHRQAKLFRQPGKGKGDAVREGIKHASGEIIMILDADITVPPEDLALFYKAIISNKGEFINGSRLVYPMEKQAMRFLNLIGNKVFTVLLSWLIGQPIKDTLCGTKVFWTSDYDVIAANRGYFGEFDPFGDFDLIFGAARINRKFVDIPIRYKERTYGDTNISRWRHGWLLARMSLTAALKLKFF